MQAGIKPRGWRYPYRVAERCETIRKLRLLGWLQNAIAQEVGLDRTTVVYHLNGKCRCWD